MTLEQLRPACSMPTPRSLQEETAISRMEGKGQIGDYL